MDATSDLSGNKRRLFASSGESAADQTRVDSIKKQVNGEHDEVNDGRSAADEDKKKKKKKGRKSKGRKSMTSRGEGKNNEIHIGSFAHSAMRNMCGLEMPELDEESAAEGQSDKGEQRVKRKVAFLLAYLGTNYGGFQMNEGQRTLQAELELAMYRCKLLTRSNFGYPYKVRSVLGF